VTLPTPDAQPSRFLPRRPHLIPSTHSMPMTPPSTTFPVTPPPPTTGLADKVTPHEHAINFATHSWDLATGGLKTLTAKRDLPMRSDRRTPDTIPDLAMSRSYLFALVILTCVVLMLIGGGVVLFVMLQP